MTARSVPPLSPLLRFLLPLAAGIAAGDFLFGTLHSFTLLIFLSALVLGAVGCALAAGGTRALAPFTAPTAAVSVFLLGTSLLLHDRTRHELPPENAARPHLVVVSDTPRQNGTLLRATCRICDQGPLNDRRIELSLSDTAHHAALRVGTPLLIHARIVPPAAARNPGESDRAAFLRRRGIDGTAHCHEGNWQVSTVPRPLSLRESLLCRREALITHYRRHLAPHTADVLAAMTLGDRTRLDRTTRQLYAESGAEHILALSGLHLAILYALYAFTLRRATRRIGRRTELAADALSLLGIWTFALLAGLPISLIRAALMLSIATAVRLFSRESHGLHSLTVTVFILLLLFPQWLFDLGFQLSCLAVAGILLLSPHLPPPESLSIVTHRAADLLGRRPDNAAKRTAKHLALGIRTLLVTSFSAQLATAPLIAFTFCRLPWSSLLSGLFVIPAAYLLLATSFAFLLLSPLRPLLAPLLSATLSTLEHGLAFFSHGPFAPLRVHPSLLTTVAAYALLLTALIVIRRRDTFTFARRLALIVTAFAFLSLSILIDDVRHRRRHTSMLVYHTYGCTAIHLTAADGRQLLLCSDTLRARSALRTTALRIWESHGGTPRFAPLSDLRSPDGCRRLERLAHLRAFAPGVLLCGGTRCAVVDRPLSYAFPATPLPVDFLLLTRHARRPLSHLLRYYRPRRIILSADLTPWWRTHYTAACRKAHLPLTDIADDGCTDLIQCRMTAHKVE